MKEVNRLGYREYRVYPYRYAGSNLLNSATTIVPCSNMVIRKGNIQVQFQSDFNRYLFQIWTNRILERKYK